MMNVPPFCSTQRLKHEPSSQPAMDIRGRCVNQYGLIHSRFASVAWPNWETQRVSRSFETPEST